NTRTRDFSVKGYKATGVVDYDWGGSLAEAGKRQGGHLSRLVHLEKEGGAWKITYIGPLLPEAQ
ncbi:MAG: hypothetical protein ACYDEQ_09035, partial [Desulfocucumaceae bacterium]